MAGSTLADRVYAALTVEGNGNACPVSVGGFPETGGGSLTSFELDCREWGFTFGVAYAIARGEDPYESLKSVIDRALEAAREAFTQWGDADVVFTPLGYLKDRGGRPNRTEAEAVA